jgi:hypothetical protein
MMHKAVTTIVAVLVITACAASYKNAIPGVDSLGKMQVNIDEGWQIAARSMTPYARSMSRTYTREGLPMDRVTLITGVDDGDTIFKNSAAALPAFRSAMSSEQIEGLVQSSLQSLFAAGDATVSTTNRRPHGFSGMEGILFDVSMLVTDGADSRGVIGAFVYEERLYLILYVAQDPGYYKKHLAGAMAVIDSVAVKVPVTGKF